MYRTPQSKCTRSEWCCVACSLQHKKEKAAKQSQAKVKRAEKQAQRAAQSAGAASNRTNAAQSRAAAPTTPSLFASTAGAAARTGGHKSPGSGDRGVEDTTARSEPRAQLTQTPLQLSEGKRRKAARARAAAQAAANEAGAPAAQRANGSNNAAEGAAAGDAAGPSGLQNRGSSHQGGPAAEDEGSSDDEADPTRCPFTGVVRRAGSLFKSLPNGYASMLSQSGSDIGASPQPKGWSQLSSELPASASPARPASQQRRRSAPSPAAAAKPRRSKSADTRSADARSDVHDAPGQAVQPVKAPVTPVKVTASIDLCDSDDDAPAAAGPSQPVRRHLNFGTDASASRGLRRGPSMRSSALSTPHRNGVSGGPASLSPGKRAGQLLQSPAKCCKPSDDGPIVLD